MAESQPPGPHRVQTQLKFAMLFLIAINVAILVVVFLPPSKKAVKPIQGEAKAAETMAMIAAPPAKTAGHPAESPIPNGSPTLVRRPAEAGINKEGNPDGGQALLGQQVGGSPAPASFPGMVMNLTDANFSVAGKVKLTGTPSPEREITPIRADARCGALHTEPVYTRSYVVAADGGLANVMVYITEGLPAAEHFAVPERKPMIDQTGCLYEPYVTAVMAGQSFVVRNSDALMHNVNAMAKVNRPFNFAQASQGQENTVSFDKPELVKLVCNVHPWMAGYVLVSEHPFFAVTDGNGEFRIPAGLPEGDYTLEFMHLKAGKVQAKFTLRGGKPPIVSAEMAVQ